MLRPGTPAASARLRPYKATSAFHLSTNWRTPLRLLAPALAGLIFVLVFMEPTPLEIRAGDTSLDQWCADVFWWPGIRQWSLAHAGIPKLVFYDGAKDLIIALGVVIGALALSPACMTDRFRRRLPGLPSRRAALYLTLCLALIPLACNRTKTVSNIYCPYEHSRYGGKAPYVRLWDAYPEEFKAVQRANPNERGHAFPAGHASGGFALLGFAFTLRRRWIGIALGTGVGWAMGLYQMARGAHYLSHTLVTWCVAWIGVVLLAALVKPPGWEKTAED